MQEITIWHMIDHKQYFIRQMVIADLLELRTQPVVHDHMKDESYGLITKHILLGIIINLRYGMDLWEAYQVLIVKH